ncbi:MAG: hypothetical protein JW822_07990 [Spirochaetales bacterium]|nr:hypothetical protein [Spirochaetales bacterium]
MIFLIFITPCSVFSQNMLDEDFIRNQYKWLADNANGCVCLGWSKSGSIAYLTTVEPSEPVGGFYLELAVTDLITDVKLAVFTLKGPTEGILNPDELHKAISFCKAKNIEPYFAPLHTFPLYYNDDTYSVGILDEGYNDPQGRVLLLRAENAHKYKPLDAQSTPENIAGYFLARLKTGSRFVCISRLRMGGPALS